MIQAPVVYAATQVTSWWLLTPTGGPEQTVQSWFCSISSSDQVVRCARSAGLHNLRMNGSVSVRLTPPTAVSPVQQLSDCCTIIHRHLNTYMLMDSSCVCPTFMHKSQQLLKCTANDLRQRFSQPGMLASRCTTANISSQLQVLHLDCPSTFGQKNWATKSCSGPYTRQMLVNFKQSQNRPAGKDNRVGYHCCWPSK